MAKTKAKTTETLQALIAKRRQEGETADAFTTKELANQMDCCIGTARERIAGLISDGLIEPIKNVMRFDIQGDLRSVRGYRMVKE